MHSNMPFPLYEVTPSKNMDGNMTTSRQPYDWKEWWREFLFYPNNSKGARELYRSSYAYKKEREARSQAHRQFIIHPFSAFRWIWDLFIVIALSLALILQPIELAFFTTYVTTFDIDKNTTTTYMEIEAEEFWSSLSLVVDAVFFLDIIINFRTAYIDHETEMIIYDSKIIAVKYLTSWFCVDLITSMPLDQIYTLFAGDSDTSSFTFNFVKLLKLFTMVKVLRILRLFRYVHALEDFLQIRGAVLSLVHLVVVALLFLHWTACVQYLVPLLQQFPPNTWVHKYPLDLREKDKFFRYSVSMYRASNALMSSGWGVFSYSEYNNQAQIWTDIVTYLIGRTFYVLFIVTFKRIGEKSDPEKKRARLLTQEIKEYMRYKKVPKDLQLKVKDCYSYIQNFLYFDENYILFRQHLPGPLREELLLHNLKTILMKVPFLESNSQSFLDDILTKLKFQAYMDGEVIIQAGKRGKSVFFIDCGVVEFLDEAGNVVEERRNGQHFGETSLLLNQPEQETVVAQETCDIYELSKSDFLEVLEEHPYVEADFLTRANLVNILADRIQQKQNEDDALDGDDDLDDDYGDADMDDDEAEFGELCYFMRTRNNPNLVHRTTF